MRLLSKIFQPVVVVPKNATIKSTEITSKSQKLLVELGLIRPASHGFFTILPLAQRVLDKLEAHFVRHLESFGANRISLPSVTSSQLWRDSGRLQAVGAELMRFTDRHQQEYVLAPTHEEAIADLLADVGPLSYKQLPLYLYQISNKYRDELRAKHGLLRAREFKMLDMYGVHNSEGVRTEYEGARAVVRRAVEEILPVYEVEASPGDMGGSLSHEFQLPCEVGEDSITVCEDCQAARAGVRESERCQCGGKLSTVSSIEHGLPPNNSDGQAFPGNSGDIRDTS